MTFLDKTIKFQALPKPKRGDRVAILSPSFAAPGMWPHVHALGLERLTRDFGLVPVEYPTTAKLGAAAEERAADLVAAFGDPSIKAVIATLGGDDQVVYAKHLPARPFVDHPKPFFGYSDNTHFQNHLWLNGIPSYYGGHLFTEFAMNVRMDGFTAGYLERALFGGGRVRLEASPTFNDVGLDWGDPENLARPRRHEANEGWRWDGAGSAAGITWGGCLESIDELLRHGVAIPSPESFGKIVLFVETSEEIPSHDYVARVFRALGERGILGRTRGLLVGRPKAWNFDRPWPDAEKAAYRERQRETIVRTVRRYNARMPIVQNLDFGHTSPQICLPFGRRIEIDADRKEIHVEF